MANDRLRVRCNVCSAEERLFKYYPENGGYIYEDAPERLTEFFNKHISECGGVYGPTLGGAKTMNEVFSFATESTQPVERLEPLWAD